MRQVYASLPIFMRGSSMACDLRCVSFNPPHYYRCIASNWTFFRVCIITVRANQILLQAKVRQRYSDDEVCFLPSSFLSMCHPSALECSSWKFEWMTLSVGRLAESVSVAFSPWTHSCATVVNLFRVEASSGTLARSSRLLLFLLDGDPAASSSSLELVDIFRSSPTFMRHVWPFGRLEMAMTIVMVWRSRRSVALLSALCRAGPQCQRQGSMISDVSSRSTCKLSNDR